MRRFLLLLAWLAIFLCVPVQTAALAAEPAKPLTVQAVFEGQLPLAEMRFDVYRVADRSGGGTEAWAALARVLEKVALMEEACRTLLRRQTRMVRQSLTRCGPACIC